MSLVTSGLWTLATLFTGLVRSPAGLAGALALVPAWWYARGSLVLPRRERRFVAIAWSVFLLFASANQYSRAIRYQLRCARSRPST